MKAVIRTTYGSPAILSIKEIGKPSPKENEVLVRVHAATVSRTDCGILTGKPYITRLFTGITKPGTQVTGSDFAGQVVGMGKNVRSFKVGDRVMGFGGMAGSASHAQFLTFAETKGITTIPTSLNYEEAAACLEGAFYASTGIRKLQPTAGQKAVVYGATGAIGSAYVQMLKHAGVFVTAVCGGEHRKLVESLGADKIVDYRTEDFTNDTEQYDFVFDAVGKTSFAQCKKLLTKKGIYSWSDGFVNILLSMVTPMMGGKKVVFYPPTDIRGGINFVKNLVEQGSFKPVIDRKYPLENIREAYTYVASGQKTGNVIVLIFP